VKTLPQKTIQDTTTPTPKTIPQKLELTQPKIMPPEIKILLDTIEEFLEIGYAAQQKILQLYGPVEYRSVNDIELEFTPEQARSLNFELIGENWIIHPKRFLDKDCFNQILTTVKRINGEYTPATKDAPGYFKVKRA
jgi:hypothetical protein